MVTLNASTVYLSKDKNAYQNIHVDCDISQFTVLSITYVSVVKPLTYHLSVVSRAQIMDFIHHIFVVHYF
jgi:hypothetical protein